MNTPQEVLTRDAYASALRAVGLERGDVVFVQSALWPIGPVAGATDSAGMLEFYLSGLRDVLGSEGTITVLTSFEDYGRYGTPFIVESSPSRNGAFSEYIRTQPGAVRSVHPLASIAGLGPQAEAICGGNHFTGMGYDSPWGRLHRAGAKLLDLGLRFREIASWDHYVEAMFGVPYQYNKVFNAPVIKDGVAIPGPFVMSVRYLDFSIAYDTSRYEERLTREGLLKEAKLGRSVVQAVDCVQAFEVGTQCLNEDRYFFLKEPPKFRPGEYPTDGVTGPMKAVYHDAGPNVRKGAHS